MSFAILEACSTTHVQQVQFLLREYVATSLVDLSSQSIDAEIAGLPGDYAPPTGALFLATSANGKPAGCVAIHKFGKPGDAELKRLFVAPSYRGLGLGKALVTTALAHAKQMGFSRLVLDTMPEMTAAIAAYEGLGFQRVDPYWDNVLPVIYFGKSL
ncbi:GNAT family N-acetyltransferase [Rhizobium sp. Leaf262]|uniref:GNAT family N-acetyltransferase n=1 Tax=Rhizobium sp. Leaf262 TaxID=1736312 RepID=UPI0007159C01|nr:GNAT family N-acetyltransferase [Rhizobium sp. Leaf262]KQO75077.1 hypothetical protein ASF29_14355 [Rhizobium sp. Leaf262]